MDDFLFRNKMLGLFVSSIQAIFAQAIIFSIILGVILFFGDRPFSLEGFSELITKYKIAIIFSAIVSFVPAVSILMDSKRVTIVFRAVEDDEEEDEKENVD